MTKWYMSHKGLLEAASPPEELEGNGAQIHGTWNAFRGASFREKDLLKDLQDCCNPKQLV
jgi:hypothetical protein